MLKWFKKINLSRATSLNFLIQILLAMTFKIQYFISWGPPRVKVRGGGKGSWTERQIGMLLTRKAIQLPIQMAENFYIILKVFM